MRISSNFHQPNDVNNIRKLEENAQLQNLQVISSTLREHDQRITAIESSNQTIIDELRDYVRSTPVWMVLSKDAKWTMDN